MLWPCHPEVFPGWADNPAYATNRRRSGTPMNQRHEPATREIGDDDAQTIADLLNAPNLLAVTDSLKAHVERAMDARDVAIAWRLPHGTDHSAPSPAEIGRAHV